MRVALVSPLFESVPPRRYGGTERVVYNLCHGLKERGIDVTLFASGDSQAGVPLVPIVEEAFRLSGRPVRDPAAYHFKMLAEVARRAHEFDVIHNHHDYWMLPLAKMTGTPILTTLHGRLDIPELVLPLPEFDGSWFVSISDSQRSALPGLPWLGTIHHGIDASNFQFRAEPGKYLAFLGRIDDHKRPEYAIEIAKRSGVPLKIAAKIEGREAQAYYDAHVAPHVDGSFIEYVGEITESEKSEFLGGALALVFPIDWPEPFGLVMLESLACGTPVLARPRGAAPEVLRSGVTGYVHEDLGVLAESVRNLDRISRHECRRWVETRFSLGRMTEDYVNVYGTLAGVAESRDLHRGFRRAGPDRHRRHFVHSI
ncbi:MAG TPA: glycosyltransferase family 4 protein [Bdellovibrionota bacterium]|nr:glycosyltransferase family 4 protein [Bdellovibrionota bacterium]